MMPIQAGFFVNSASFRGIDPSSLKKTGGSEASEASSHSYQAQQQKYLEAHYTNLNSTSNQAALQDYATVSVNGKVVARIDNSGSIETSNGLGSSLFGDLPNAVNGKSGPMLAQARAERIAELTGGKVEISAAALTQAEFDALPQYDATLTVAATQKDPVYEQLQQPQQALSEFMTQLIAQESDDANATSSDAATEFLDYMSKTPEERFFAAFLKEEGLTEEQFEKLPPKERAALMQDFEQEMKDKTLEGVAENMDRAT
ncbi:hypothetical protein [Denitrobaculum tricleocarpae]|uniref:Uncharacterized protein n=1 Tax=Denitrobaculum tricleocarpae TaxID=2591009 RepID=A0A545TKL6_9PROT|nr:hypothetical protein [Denitrobaculum tricleocarpae]TQV77780.1 hypothetical protein FKG95_19665 [Denitrobaculum tricleocarpae]